MIRLNKRLLYCWELGRDMDLLSFPLFAREIIVTGGERGVLVTFDWGLYLRSKIAVQYCIYRFTKNWCWWIR